MVVAAGLAVGFGLNSEPIENGLAGDADAAGVAAGDAPAFLRPRVFVGEAEASGLLAGAGEVSAFFLRTFLADEADVSGLASGGGPGLCASTKEAHAKIIIDKSKARFVVIHAG